MKIETLTTAEEALRSLSEKLISIIGQSRVNPFHIALSGRQNGTNIIQNMDKRIQRTYSLGYSSFLLGRREMRGPG